jgi:chorismate mutase
VRGYSRCDPATEDDRIEGQRGRTAVEDAALNEIDTDALISVMFTATPDITSGSTPCRPRTRTGDDDRALCAVEMDVQIRAASSA